MTRKIVKKAPVVEEENKPSKAHVRQDKIDADWIEARKILDTRSTTFRPVHDKTEYLKDNFNKTLLGTLPKVEEEEDGGENE